MTTPECTCGTDARRQLAAAGINPDDTPTPPLTGDGPEVIGTCEHGVAWPALDREGAS